MRLFLYDLETSGLSPQNDRILEYGYIIWDTKYKKPFAQNSVILFESDYPTKWPEAEKVNGISYEYASTFGIHPKPALESLDKLLTHFEIDYMVAHNGKLFDLPFLIAQCEKYELPAFKIKSTPLIDTKELPFNHAPRSKHLGHLAYDLRVFHDPAEKHSALFDCQLMLGILKTFDIDQVLKSANAKSIKLHAHCTFETKELAKSCGYSWTKPQNQWLKNIKEYELDEELAKAKATGFEVTICS